jgi:pimeloyl-ACP methyl ester carboxylesterase
MLVDIGGRRLAIEFAGEGTPVVVLEAFGGAGLDVWQPIWEQLTQLTRICCYDRAGTGQSDPSTLPLTGLQLVADLRALLIKTATPLPVILVGASFGGAIMQLYARTYPEDVCGLVLLDSMHCDQVARFYAYSQTWGDELVAEIAEHLAGIDWTTTAQQLRDALPLAPIPLAVVSRGKSTPVAAVWSELQKELASQVPTGQQIIAEQSGHGIHFDQPELVIDVIREMVIKGEL